MTKIKSPSICFSNQKKVSQSNPEHAVNVIRLPFSSRVSDYVTSWSNVAWRRVFYIPVSYKTTDTPYTQNNIGKKTLVNRKLIAEE